MAAQSSGLELALKRIEPIVASLIRTAKELGGRMSDAAREIAWKLRIWWVTRSYPALLRWTNRLRAYAASRPVPSVTQTNGAAWPQMRPVAAAPRLFVPRPTGVTIIAILTFAGAGILMLGSFAFFFVAVMAMTGGDAADPVSAAIAGMGVAGGFSLLVLAGVAGCLAVGVLELQEWARVVSIGSIAAGIGCAVASIFAFVGYGVMPVVPMVVGHVVVIGAASWMLEYLARPTVRRAFQAVTV